MPEDVPGVKRGHDSQPWGKRRRGSESRSAFIPGEDTVNLTGFLRGQRSGPQQTKLPFQKTFHFITPLPTLLQGEKNTSLMYSIGLAETTCSCGDGRILAFRGTTQEIFTLTLRLNCHS